jgi:hypothetical protein
MKYMLKREIDKAFNFVGHISTPASIPKTETLNKLIGNHESVESNTTHEKYSM